jgi:hypothetical protein
MVMKWPGRGSVHPSARTLLRLFEASGATAELDEIARDIGCCGCRAVQISGLANSVVLILLDKLRLRPGIAKSGWG